MYHIIHSSGLNPSEIKIMILCIYSICIVHAYRNAGSGRLINPSSSDQVIKILHVSYTHNVAFLPHTSTESTAHKATQEYILYAPQIAEKIQNVSTQV